MWKIWQLPYNLINCPRGGSCGATYTTTYYTHEVTMNLRLKYLELQDNCFPELLPIILHCIALLSGGSGCIWKTVWGGGWNTAVRHKESWVGILNLPFISNSLLITVYDFSKIHIPCCYSGMIIVLIDFWPVVLGFNNISHHFTKHALCDRYSTNTVITLCNLTITTQ